MSKVPFKEAFLFWLKLGFISFGGPAGQIAIMHQYLVEKKKWISERVFLHALNYCMLLPGPEAQQLAAYSGWLMHGTIVGIVAGLLFILPSVFILTGLSIVYVTYGNTPIITGIFYGIKPAVVAIVFLAVWKIGERALKRRIDLFLAAASFMALLAFKVPYTLVMLGSIITGVLYVSIFKPHTAGTDNLTLSYDDENTYLINKNSTDNGRNFKWGKFALKTVFFLVLWIIPFCVFYILTSDFKFWRDLSLFFTQAAIFTFGGAYSVLTYVAQFAVDKLHWLSQSEMIDGLALGETTPGPLMMVLPFTGFMGAYHHFGGSIAAACFGLLLSTYFTFFPSFVFILLGAPVVEKTQDNQNVKLALGFVTAAVVGVIANLGIFTAKAVLFPSGVALANLNWQALAWIIVSVIAMKKFGVNMILWIGVSAVVGLIFHSLI
jgi:chromate transporter